MIILNIENKIILKLTQKYIQSLFDYSDDKLYWKVKPRNQIKIGDKAGSLINNGYYSIKINNKLYRTHRLIFLYHYNYLPKFIDHIDNNPLNNKIENLRKVTMSQNIMNSRLNKNSSSQYKGVSWDKSTNKWLAQIRINNKQIHLGRFKSETDAAIAYNEKAKELFGEYSYLNEVE